VLVGAASMGRAGSRHDVLAAITTGLASTWLYWVRTDTVPVDVREVRDC
jgi:hypothetical protein